MSVSSRHSGSSYFNGNGSPIIGACWHGEGILKLCSIEAYGEDGLNDVVFLSCVRHGASFSFFSSDDVWSPFPDDALYVDVAFAYVF